MGVCDVPAISKVCQVAGEGAGALVAAPFDWLASAIGHAAGWMFTNVWEVLDTTTLVDITNPSYVRVYNLVFGIAVFVMLIFFLLQLITGVVRRDPSALSKAALGLAKSVLGSFLTVTLVAMLLEVTDQLAIGLVRAAGMSMEQMGDRITALPVGLTALNIAGPRGVGAVITIFLGSLAISAAALLWFSLLIRKALLLVAIVLAPVALAGTSWEATKGWIGKWASFVVALIVSKLVVVLVFLVAVNQVSGPTDADLASITDPIAGIVLMFVAAFAPYMVYKFLSFTGLDHWHAASSETEARQSLQRPIAMPRRQHSPELSSVLTDPAAGTSGGGSGQPSLGSAGASGGAGSGGGGAALGGAAAAGVVAGAGPKSGGAVGAKTESHAGAAAGSSGQGSAPPTSPGHGHGGPPPPPPAPNQPAGSVPGEPQGQSPS